MCTSPHILFVSMRACFLREDSRSLDDSSVFFFFFHLFFEPHINVKNLIRYAQHSDSEKLECEFEMWHHGQYCLVHWSLLLAQAIFQKISHVTAQGGPLVNLAKGMLSFRHFGENSWTQGDNRGHNVKFRIFHNFKEKGERKWCR